MINSSIQTEIKNWINGILVGMPDTFLLSLNIDQNGKIEVFLDADNGVNISTCTTIARAINKNMEEQHADIIYELEVSSAGLDQPLQQIRQYQKNIGRMLEVTQKNGDYIEGKLLSIGEVDFTIEAQNPKAKSKKIQKTIAFNDTEKVLVGVIF